MTMNHNQLVEDEHAVWLGDRVGKGKDSGLTAALDMLYQEGPDPKAIAAAEERVRQALSREQSEIIYYDDLKGIPLGRIWVAVREGKLISVSINSLEGDFIGSLENRFGATTLRSSEETRDAKDQLREYFVGQRSHFDLPVFVGYLSDFQQLVLRETSRVPHGQVTTYGEIARRIGKKGAARAVGQVLANNPIPIVIPCHRVLGSDGGLHGYSGGKGLETKADLLRLEGSLQV
jgi:methylated-DNA-[protein]-cysteine S-methyltransferase